MQNVYVITGGSGGIGLEVAKKIKDGIVLICDVNEKGLAQGKEQLQAVGIDVRTLICDITKQDDIAALVKQAKSAGEIKGVVHTAGIAATVADWRLVMKVDLLGTARIITGFSGHLARGAALICTASMMGYVVADNTGYDALLVDPLKEGFMEEIAPWTGDRSDTAYNFAKKGVRLLCEKYAMEYGNNGNRIISVSPGIIDTPMAAEAAASHQAQMEKMKAITPLARTGKPEEVASVMAFLLSDQAAFLTGSDILLDGGLMPALKKLYLGQS